MNEQRFAYPLLQVGVADKALVKAYSDNFFDDIVYKKNDRKREILMLDIKFVRANPDVVKQNIKNKWDETKIHWEKW